MMFFFLQFDRKEDVFLNKMLNLYIYTVQYLYIYIYTFNFCIYIYIYIFVCVHVFSEKKPKTYSILMIPNVQKYVAYLKQPFLLVRKNEAKIARKFVLK